ncbi:hypothetical protein BDZ91DRAFT_824157 [Kalaharituber pfeilii]|nr:hypothetical protein BDZ91DRAFT_824157 [Kalaharituber pfeilii]
MSSTGPEPGDREGVVVWGWRAQHCEKRRWWGGRELLGAGGEAGWSMPACLPACLHAVRQGRGVRGRRSLQHSQLAASTPRARRGRGSGGPRCGQLEELSASGCPQSARAAGVLGAPEQQARDSAREPASVQGALHPGNVKCCGGREVLPALALSSPALQHPLATPKAFFL